MGSLCGPDLCHRLEFDEGTRGKYGNESHLGYVPKLNLKRFSEKIDMDELCKGDKNFWIKELDCAQKHFDDQLGLDLFLGMRTGVKINKNKLKHS